MNSFGPLHSSAIFEGFQRSGRNTYAVKVSLDTVDVSAGTITGLMEVKDLVPNLDIRTYFEGEIIGVKEVGFITNKWNAKEQDDLLHWSRFKGFRSLKLNKELVGKDLKYNTKNNLSERNQIFMRWKEKCIYPLSEEKNIHGASFGGFYYLSLERSSSLILPTNSISPSRLATRRNSNPSTETNVSSSLLSSSTMSRSLSSTSSSSQTSSIESLEEKEKDNFPHIYPTPLTTGSILIPPHRPRARRFSSSSISYAEVLASPTLLELPLPSPPSSQPKESTEEILEENLQSPTNSIPIQILPVPIGTTIEEFPIPTPVLPIMSTSSRITTTSEERWNRSLMNHNNRGRAESNGDNFNHSRNFKKKEKEKDKEDWGMGSLVGAKLTGFYFFQNSEPYQELNLTYVPTSKGGSPSFEFC